MTKFLIVLGVLAVLAAVLYSQRKHLTAYEVPVPDALRTDLLLGYYLTLGEQAKETHDHVNLHWDALHMGVDGLIENMRTLAAPTVIELTGLLFERTSQTTLRAFSDEVRWGKLTELFDRLRSEGLMHQVLALAPFDEPNNHFRDGIETDRAIAMTKRIRDHYPEMEHVKLACIYMHGGPFFCIESFDLVGFDHYKAKEGIFRPGGEYDQFKRYLNPSQRTLLLAGGSKGQDPVPFVNFAHAHPEVAAIVCFIWADAPNFGEVNLGIRSLPIRDAYVSAGKSIVGSRDA